MCAISGVLGLKAPDTVLQKMLATMARRGPDDQGIFHTGDTALLHARLTILDPDGGKQPMRLN